MMRLMSIVDKVLLDAAFKKTYPATKASSVVDQFTEKRIQCPQFIHIIHTNLLFIHYNEIFHMLLTYGYGTSCFMYIHNS